MCHQTLYECLERPAGSTASPESRERIAYLGLQAAAAQTPQPWHRLTVATVNWAAPGNRIRVFKGFSPASSHVNPATKL